MNVVMNDNVDYAILAGGKSKVLGTNVQVNNNRHGGILAAGVKISNLTARGNGAEWGGLYLSRGGSLVDSTVTANNGVVPAIGNGFDIIARKRVRLVNTVCGQTARVKPTLTGTPLYVLIGSLRGCIPSPSGAFLD